MSDKLTNKTFVIALALAFVGSLAGGAAAAQGNTGGMMNDGKRGGMMGPARFDANGDGEVTLEEFNAGHANMFEKMDTNGDGMISLDEFNAAHEKMFEMMDTNGDGVLSGDELRPAGKMRGNRGGSMRNTTPPADGGDE